MAMGAWTSWAGATAADPREDDGDVDENDALGRIGWFEHPGMSHALDEGREQ